jgi:hypothetical protein
MRGRFCLAALLTAVLIPTALTAQDNAQDSAQTPRFFVMHQEMAKPSMLRQYEEVNKEFIATVQKHHAHSPAFSFTTVAGDDHVYTYITPVRGFTDIESIYNGFAALAKAEGEARWGDLMRRGGDAMEYVRESILMEDPSLSYTPEKQRLKSEEEAYLHVKLFYLKPGYETEADDVARQIASLFRQKKVELGYRLFKVVLGPEMPLLIVVIGAKDPADYAMADKAHLEVLGAEGQALFQRVFAITRRVEQHGGWVRPDLSLAPVAANAKK